MSGSRSIRHYLSRLLKYLELNSSLFTLNNYFWQLSWVYCLARVLRFCRAFHIILNSHILTLYFMIIFGCPSVNSDDFYLTRLLHFFSPGKYWNWLLFPGFLFEQECGNIWHYITRIPFSWCSRFSFTYHILIHCPDNFCISGL